MGPGCKQSLKGLVEAEKPAAKFDDSSAYSAAKSSFYR
jgi:hypothetical protein